MNDKKNIERLFQEKFKDFEVLPPNNTWDNIASKLEDSTKKKSRRVMPGWIKTSGIAASLIFSYFLIKNNSVIESSNNLNNNDQIVVDNPTRNNRGKEVENNAKKEDSKTKNTTLKSGGYFKESNINYDENLVSNSKFETELIQKNKADGGVIKNQNVVSSSNKIFNKISSFKEIDQTKLNAISNKNTVTNIIIKNKNLNNNRNQSKQNNKSADENLTILKNQNFISDFNIVANSLTSEEKINNKINKESSKIISQNNSDKIIENDFLTNSSSLKNNQNSNRKYDFNDKPLVIEKVNKFTTEKEFTINNDTKYSEDKKSNIKNVSSKITNLNQLASVDIRNNKDINTVIDSDQKDNSYIKMNNNSLVLNSKTTDSIPLNTIAENPLDKILKDKEAEKTEDSKKDLIVEKEKKWKVRPNAAPIYMSSSGGSPIDSRFSDNSKSYNNNLSIGVGIDYAMSKRFSFRTGVNKYDLSYNTNDVSFFANLKVNDPNNIARGSSIPSINISQTASVMTISDSFGLNSIDPEIGQNKKTGSLNQSFGYLEFPTEVSYKIIDKKFGLQIITGFSTLILNNNKLFLLSNSGSTNVGEANNLNAINFSSNVGIGFKYNFWKSFEANFEPTFKYQFFTFNTNSGGFKPYFIGLYSGISYTF